MGSGKPLQLIWLPTGGHIGDAVMVMSVFAETLERMPELHVQYLVRRNASFIAELARAYPHVSIVPVSYAPLQALKTLLPLFKERSVVIAPPPWGSRPLVLKILCLLFKFRGDAVIAFDDDTLWKPYTRIVTHDRQKRYIDNLRLAVRLASLPTADLGLAPRLDLVASLPRAFPFTETPYMVVHPFPHLSTRKTLPLARWKHLLALLIQAYPSYGFVITGAEVDRAQAEKLGNNFGDRVFLAIGHPLQEVIGLIKGARLYLGVDTGPTHLAGVLHAPSVVLAQQNEPMWLPTYNPNATLVWEKRHCVCGIPGKRCEVWEEGEPYRRCVYDIGDDAILAAIQGRLHKIS